MSREPSWTPPPETLRSSLLEQADRVCHFFAWVIPRNGGDPVVRARQVHGDQILILSGDARSNDACFRIRETPADALITDQPDLWIGVVTADCVPLLLWDPRNQVVAAVHAGWRGVVLGIARKVVETLEKVFGSDPSALYAAWGPCVRVCCYEVGPSVLERLARAHPGWDRRFIPTRDGRGYLDLVGLCQDQLLAVGLPPDHLGGVDRCTACHPSRLPSYRREGIRARRMLHAIGIWPEREI